MTDLICVVGPRNSGKSTLVNALCSRLESEGARLGGMMQVAPIPGKEKIDWKLSDLFTGQVRTLMSVRFHEGWEQFGRFWVDFQAFAWAEQSIHQAFFDTDYLVFDEIGPIELLGRGFASSFSAALQRYKGVIVAVMRENLFEELGRSFSLDLSRAKIMRTHIPFEVQYEQVVHGK